MLPTRSRCGLLLPGKRTSIPPDRGALSAKYYKKLGGTVLYFGKPYNEIYKFAKLNIEKKIGHICRSDAQRLYNGSFLELQSGLG